MEDQSTGQSRQQLVSRFTERPMNLVILASDSPVSAFLTQQIARKRMISAIVHPQRVRRVAKSRWQRLLNPVQTIAATARGRFYSWHGKRLNRSISQQLFGSPNWPASTANEISSRAINSPEGVRLFESLKPDILLVCGAPILKPQVFSIPTAGCVNLHFGIAPDFRGQNTLFWALYQREYDKVGFTLHSIDEGVDSGAVIARGYPALDPHETEASLWVKCVRQAAQISLEFLEAAERQPQFSAAAQVCSQSAYREHDRTLWREIDFLWKRQVLNWHPPRQPARIERFYLSAASQSPIPTTHPEHDRQDKLRLSPY